MLKLPVRLLLRLCFRVRVRGMEHDAETGARTLIVTNPSSLLDGLLIASMLPQPMALAVDRKLARRWWMKPFLLLSDVVEVDFSSPTSTLSLVRALEKYRRCMVFHDRRFHNDPEYMRVLEATALIAEKARADLLPVRLDGAAYSKFSYFRHKVPLRWFPRVTLTVLPPQKLEAPQDLPPRERRRRASVQLYGMMTELLYSSTRTDRNIMQSFTDAVRVFGRSRIIAEDQDRRTLTYGAMLTRARALGMSLAREFRSEQRVGFMMPNSLAGLVGFLALQSARKVPAMINFTAGARPVLSGCRTTELKSILTSRTFIKLGELESLEKAMKDEGLRLVYLEDIAATMPLRDKVGGLLASWLLCAPKTPADEAAVILFTSGTEGMPKAVFLSHRNLAANREQMLCVVNVNAGDRIFNCLPMFHSFGLGIGTILPLVTGIRVIVYPSPLHYRNVPQLFYESQSTVICGTDTFFAGYARYGRPYDFFNARLVIAGAEKLRESTARLWKEKFGVTMVEGYGATETSPVISVNTPANIRAGSVGRLAPGMRCRVRPVEGIDDCGGRVGELWVKGDNVMMGYMRSTAPGVLEPPRDPALDPEEEGPEAEGWYDTGDIVEVDAENFIFIKGRAKRFAKVGGEMISLAAVENALRDLWPDVRLGVVSVPDARKGEQLALLVEREGVTSGQIATAFAARGLSPLWTPKRILCVRELPLLGSGKFDYRTAREMAIRAERRA